MEPRTFSFNSPYGACPECQGLGFVSTFDPDLIVPDRHLSLARGAIAPWREVRGKKGENGAGWLDAFLKRHSLKRSTALSDWPPERVAHILRLISFSSAFPALNDGIEFSVDDLARIALVGVAGRPFAIYTPTSAADAAEHGEPRCS